MQLLLVEDDLMLGEALLAGLQQDGYQVEWLRSGHYALARCSTRTTPLDAIVLDLGLPDLPGLHVLSELRRKGITTPVLIITARDGVRDRITGLDSGADDYLVKPVDLDELSARLRACIRRSGGAGEKMLKRGALQLDTVAHTVSWQQQAVELSTQEFALLRILLSQPGRVQTREQLEERLYSWGKGSESNVLEVLIHRLRKKFGNQLIRTVRGVGYVIDPEPPECVG
jgi:DNA-binding response OmpR family regulator